MWLAPCCTKETSCLCGNSNYRLFFKTSSLQLSCHSLPDTAPGTADGTSWHTLGTSLRAWVNHMISAIFLIPNSWQGVRDRCLSGGNMGSMELQCDEENVQVRTHLKEIASVQYSREQSASVTKHLFPHWSIQIVFIWDPSQYYWRHFLFIFSPSSIGFAEERCLSWEWMH